MKALQLGLRAHQAVARERREVFLSWCRNKTSAVGLDRPYVEKARSRLKFRKYLTGTLGGAAVLLGGLAAIDEGVERTLLFWSRALPIFAHYKFIQWQIAAFDVPDDEADGIYEELHTKYSPVVEKATLELRGFYLKTAQIVSTIDFFVPDQYMEWCKRLQDQAPTELKPGQAREIITRSLGQPLEDIFTDFEEEPCGSASIGQVHRAKLKSDGSVVAIKVQAPQIEKKFRSDIGTIKSFCQLAMPQHVKAMDEIEKQFETEFDYVGEAKNLLEIHDNIMPKFGHLVAIPKPYMDLCSRDILVMEFIEGENLVKGAQRQLREYAESIGRPYKEVEKEQLDLIKSGHLRDIDQERSRIKRYQKLLDMKHWIRNAYSHSFNLTFGWILPNKPYTKSARILNLADIIERVAMVHGHQIMVDGAFNGDPHPGNIILMPDGRLGLIDYGQCKHICKESRILYARLVLALLDEDQDLVANIMRQSGYRTKYDDPYFLFKLAQFWHDRNTPDVTNGMNIQTFMEWLEKKDPLLDISSDFMIPGRVSVLLRGVGNFFGLDMSMAKLWAPVAKEVLKQADVPTKSS